MSITVSNITKLYGEQWALNNVSLNIKTGEIVGFLGPNGAGKTTMMKIITCYIPPTSGNVSVYGYDISEPDSQYEIKKHIGYLPENNPLYSEMYITEYLEFIADIHKIRKKKKQRIAEIIEITGLNIECKKKIGQLSKGYRQRVGLAQALIHNPEILILDEPTIGLDPNQIVEIRNLIKDIGKEKTVMFSTHIMQEVEAICDRVIIINQGKIIADDTIENIQRKIPDYSGKTLIVEFNKPINKILLQSIEEISFAENLKGNIWKIHTRSEKDIREYIFQFAVQNNLTVLSMNLEEQTLEKVFQILTKQ